MRFVSDSLGLNEKGHLTIGGVDTIALAEEYGTPLYVMDEDLIRRNCKTFKRSLARHFEARGMICYASKAFCCKEIYRIMRSENMGLDVVSGGELYTAMKAGFDPSRIVFHGNNKSQAELEMALNYHVGRIVVDNVYEMSRLNNLAEERDTTAPVLLRITPGVEAHTHEYIQTGQNDTKFGFTLETSEALSAVYRALSEYDNLDLRGLHCHIGSQILDTHGFAAAAETMMEFVLKIRDSFGFEIEEMNLGGGFGVSYTERDYPPTCERFMQDIAEVVDDFCMENQLLSPTVLFEPGRAIVGEAGITLYTVGGIKRIPQIRTYVTVDGGMCDNPRYILYQSPYTALVANRAGEPKTQRVTIAGKCCENGDLIGENMPLQQVGQGDILAVCTTGAYNYSMSSNYNRIPRPAVVFVRKGEARLAVRRETYDDLLSCDV